MSGVGGGGGGGISQSDILSDATPFAGAKISTIDTNVSTINTNVGTINTNLDVKSSSVQRTVLQALAGSGKLVLEQKAAIDEATYTNIAKSGNNYVISATTIEVGGTVGQTTPANAIYAVTFTPAASSDVTSLRANVQSTGGNARMALYSDVAGVPTTLIAESSPVALSGTGWTDFPITASIVGGTPYWVCIMGDTTVGNIYYSGTAGRGKAYTYAAFPASMGATSAGYGAMNMRIVTTGGVTSGDVKSNAIAKDANIGLRYWGDIVANLVAGSAGSTVSMKICDSAGTPLHSNFVTIDSSEYSRIPLERPVVLTATSNSQTVWNFTSLSNADAFIDELGVLAKALLVELSTDGTNYTVLKEVTDFSEDITNVLAPKITLVSGSGVVSGTSKLRSTYIIKIPLSNTTIKVDIKLARLVGTDTSPSIQPLIGDATKYVSAGQVAVI